MDEKYKEFFQHIDENISDEMKKFVDDDVFGESEYLFIDKNNTGFCSKCHSEYVLAEKYKQNSQGICPNCEAKLQVKLSRYGRQNCTNSACFYYFEKSVIDPSVVVCKGYYVSRSYEDYKNPCTDYILESIYIFQSGKKSKMLKFYYSNFWGGRWEETRSIFNFNQNWLANMPCYFSYESIRKAIKGTNFQYIPKEFLDGNRSIVKPFDEFAKYPWLEQIYKIGFKEIVKSKIYGENIYDCLNYKGKDIFKILRLSRKDVKDIKDSKVLISPRFLKFYQLQNKDNCRFSPEQVKDIANNYCYSYAAIKKILNYTTMKKAIKYISKQYEKRNEHCRNYTKSDLTTVWRDYIDDCTKLDMDIKNENILYPKDVYTAHQNTIKQVKYKGDQIIDKKIQARYEKLIEKYYFEYEGLIIKPPMSTQELIAEGKIQNICIGGYAQRYSEGKTDLLFIRKISEPDKPYYAMEVYDGRILQTRGKSNCSPQGEVIKFVEAFREKLEKKKEKIRIPA